MKRKILYLFFAITSTLCALEEEDLIWNEGPSIQEINRNLKRAIADKDWWNVIDTANFIAYNFATSPFAQETSFIIAEAYFNLGEYETSNLYLTNYLNQTTSPKHFDTAISYKFSIAEEFANGTKKRLFSSGKMPAILDAKEDAVAIFDEVIAAVPHSEFAAKSLLKKAQLQLSFEDYKPSLESLDVLIRRFPKHQLAAEGYLQKCKNYLVQCEAQNLDPDLLDLCDVNLKKFKIAFPRDERIKEAEKTIESMQELYAKQLFEIASFFEKTKKNNAAVVYYKKIVSSYPNTLTAQKSREKVETLSTL
jgi:outer membrane protein assembly factor BamD (BamD/ComL family)